MSEHSGAGKKSPAPAASNQSSKGAQREAGNPPGGSLTPERRSARWRDPADLPGELWAETEGFQGYEVSSLGRIRSRLRTHVRILIGSSTRGYPQVQLMREGRKFTRPLHRLVVEAFIGPIPLGMVVRHLDGDKVNARVANLAIGTWSENELDKGRHGVSNAGERNHAAKLNWNAVREIRASGETGDSLARRFGVTRYTIVCVRTGRTWKEG